MKTAFWAPALLILCLTSPQSAQAGMGVIVETIKAHIDQRPPPAPRLEQRQTASPLPSQMEQWVRSILDSLGK